MISRTAIMLAGFVAAGASAQNLLVNAGFEDPITQDGPPFVGLWEGFNAGAGSAAFNGSTTPRSGAQHLQLEINGIDNSFAGAFQDVDGLSAGDMVTFSGWHARGTASLNVGVEIRIEFRDSLNNIEIGRTGNLTIAPTGMAYEQFSLAALMPTGADLARVVYAIQTFGGDGDGSNTGTVFIDDVRFIPAPGAAAVMGLGALAAGRRRR